MARCKPESGKKARCGGSGWSVRREEVVLGGQGESVGTEGKGETWTKDLLKSIPGRDF
jgi:hypothetical protein